MSDKNSKRGADSSPPSGASAAVPDESAEETAEAVPVEAADAPGLPDLEAHTEAPAWLSGGEDHDAEIWSGAFEAEDVDITAPSEDTPDLASAEDIVLPAEPSVTHPDDVVLETPSLGDPDIGAEAAEAASLEETAAEVKAVEAQAADAAVLTDPAANRRAAGAKAAATVEPAATAQPTATAEPEATAEPVATPEPATAPGSTATAEPAATAEPEATAKPEATAGPAATNHTEGIAAAAPMSRNAAEDEARPDDNKPEPAPTAAESRRSRRTAEQPPAESGGNSRTKRLLLIIGGIGVLVILAVLLFTVLGGEKEPGVLEEDVAPIELESGACLTDFTGVNDPTTVVTCETPHNAQLVATVNYAEEDEFPGADALTERANEICAGVRYSEAATENTGLDLQVSKAVPTPASWEDGDRRVDCFVVAGEGQELTESLIEQ